MSAQKIPVRSLRPEIHDMLFNEGVYVAGDVKQSNVMVAMVSIAGKIYALRPGEELDPFRFLDSMILSGPFLPDHAAR